MRTRILGKTGIEVSEVGFGAWAVGGPAALGQFQIGWGVTDDAESVRAIETAFDCGVNFFDTADVYGAGHSEELLARVLAGRRDRVVIASKGGNTTDSQGLWVKDFSGGFLAGRVEDSLRRLKTGYIDLYQLHTPRSPEQLQQSFDSAEKLDRLVEQGKLRSYGISIGPVADGLAQIRQGFGAAIQVVYNILEREPEKELLPTARKENYGIIPRVPLAYGFLTGKFTAESTFGENDHRRHSVLPATRRNWTAKVDRLKPLANELGIPMAQLALQYVLASPSVSVVIPGGKTEKQVRQNCRAGEAEPLTEEVLDKIRKVITD